MKEITEIIQQTPQLNTQLEQFKSSIDVIINQNNEYVNSIKLYANKTFTIQTNGSEITEEEKNEIDNMLDKLEEINKRNEIANQNIDEFLSRIEEMKENVKQLKNIYLKNKQFCENKMEEFDQMIVDNYERMQEEEMKMIQEKYNQLKTPFYQYGAKVHENKPIQQIIDLFYTENHQCFE